MEQTLSSHDLNKIIEINEKAKREEERKQSSETISKINKALLEAANKGIRKVSVISDVNTYYIINHFKNKGFMIDWRPRLTCTEKCEEVCGLHTGYIVSYSSTEDNW